MNTSNHISIPMPPLLSRQKTNLTNVGNVGNHVAINIPASLHPNIPTSLPPKRPRRPTLTEANVENLETLNLSGPEWAIHVGNTRNEYIPPGLLYKKRPSRRMLRRKTRRQTRRRRGSTRL